MTEERSPTEPERRPYKPMELHLYYFDLPNLLADPLSSGGTDSGNDYIEL